MNDRDRIIRLLTIHPEDLSRWTRLCQKVSREVHLVHSDYPHLNEMQLMSFVKRLLPEIRAMISSVDVSSGHDDEL